MGLNWLTRFKNWLAPSAEQPGGFKKALNGSFPVVRPSNNVSKIRTLDNVVVVLTNEETGKRRTFESSNLVSTAGDIHFVQKFAAESPTNAFTRMVLGVGGNVPDKTSDYADITVKVTGSLKAFDSTYPKTNDPDTDNPNRAVDVVTYRTSYLTTEANATGIDRIAITNVSPGVAEPLMAYAVFGAPFDKTSADTLKVFYNIDATGV